MLKTLNTKWVGPAPKFQIELGSHLNLFTGDNGLGKSFLLDIAWWALTGTWSGHMAIPQKGIRSDDPDWPMIQFTMEGKVGGEHTLTREFHFPLQTWVEPEKRNVSGPMSPALLPGLVMYAKVDGGYSVWDPYRNDWKKTLKLSPEDLTPEMPVYQPAADRPEAFHFDIHSAWYGLSVEGNVVCNGLLQDWVQWQYRFQNRPQLEGNPFHLLEAVVKALSPHPDEPIEMAEPVRILLADAREYPCLSLPYAKIPIIHSSAGMKRVLTLAYMLVWSWHEHQQAAQLIGQPPTDRMVLIFDEVESHLHPRWQRSILPALLDVVRLLNPNIQVQILASTHAALVLASVEPTFDPARDKLFLFSQKDHQVHLDEMDWSKQGDAVGWLTSEIFGLAQARSKEAEQAIEAAEAYMRNAAGQTLTADEIHELLLIALPGHDPFWPRWIIHRDREAGKL